MSEPHHSSPAPSAAELLQREHQRHAAMPNESSTNGTQQHLSYEQMEANQQQPAATSTRPLKNGAGPDLESDSAFPALGAPANAPKTVAGWGSGPALTTRWTASPATSKGNQVPLGSSPSQTHTETLVLMSAHVAIGPVPVQFRERGPRAAGEKREEDPKTLPEVLKAVQRRHPSVVIESSTSRDKVTLLFKTPANITSRGMGSLSPDERIARAKQELVARITRKVNVTFNVPASVRPFLIGTKGKTLKSIIDATGASVQIPPRENANVITLDDHPIDGPDDGEDATPVPITITGDAQAVADARGHIEAIVKERTSRATQRITSVQKEFYLLLNGARGTKMQELITATVGVEAAGDVSVWVPKIHLHRVGQGLPISGAGSAVEEEAVGEPTRKQRDDAIVVQGHRNVVAPVVAAIEDAYTDLQRTTKKLEIELPKRQHRFLIGQNAEEILEATGSVVEVGPATDPSEKVTIRGEQMANVQALNLVMEKANAMRIDTVDFATAHHGIQDGLTYSKNLSRYLLASGKLRDVQDKHPGIKLYLPRPESICSHSTVLEIVGKEKSQVDAARQDAVSLVKTLPPDHFILLDLDPLVHKQLIGKKGQKIKQFRESKSVEVMFPPEGSAREDVMLVFLGDVDAATTLQHVGSELERLAKDAADITSVVIDVPAKLHRYILGPNGTTLNALIGEDRLVYVGVGQDSRKPDPSMTDKITIRGPSEEVSRVQLAISNLAEEGKTNDTINSYTCEFEIDTKHVSFVIGKSGAGITKLRDELGIRIDFADGVANGSSTTTKKRKPKTGITIKGRKENVEEAKKRILAQVEKLADEVTLTVPLTAGVDRGSLVGKGGKYLLRLQDTHMVHINLPRSGDEQSGNDIIIRGPKKGAEAAKKELVDLMEYEKEQGSTASLTVSARSIPRILGKGGASIDEIKESTGVLSVDVREDDTDTATITLRGTTKAISAARKAITSIAQEVDDEVSIEMNIDKAHHHALIGRGGAKLRDIVKNAGGTAEARMIQFPRAGSEGDSPNRVILKGPKIVIEKIRKELESEVDALENAVCVGVMVSRGSLPTLIGRGAVGIKDLQKKHNIFIHPPGWKEWNTAGDISNAAELEGVDEGDIVKLVGKSEACSAAAEEIRSRAPSRSTVTKSVAVPVALHGQISQQGRFFRELPRSIKVDHGKSKSPQNDAARTLPPKREVVLESQAARIDNLDEHVQQSGLIAWDVHQLPEVDLSNTIQWNITAPSEEEASEVEEKILKAIEKSKARYLAYATVSPSDIPRIVGRGGSTLARLSSGGATVEIHGPRKGSDTVLVMGELDSINKVKQQLEDLLRV